MNKSESIRKSRKNRARSAQKASRRFISGIVLALLIVLGYSTVSAYAKNQTYIQQETALLIDLEEEKLRTEEIQVFKAYTETDAYVEEVAKEKLGLAYRDEIIFQPIQ